MRWDLHIHSQYSPDSSSSIQDILKVAKKKGLDGIAITDHDSLWGYMRAKEIVKKFGLQLIPGYELMTNQGELLILGTEELIQQTLNIQEVLKIAYDLGAVVIAPHPFDPIRNGLGELLDYLKIDGIEVINGHSLNNKRAKLYAEKNNLGQTGGSDAHHHLEVGDAWTECEGDVLKSIKNRTSVAGGKGFKFKTLPLSLANKAKLLGWKVLR